MRQRQRLRVVAAGSTFAALSLPALAHATDMSGLAVIVVGMFVGVPAALLLAISIAISLVARGAPKPSAWHRPYARGMLFVAPLLGVIYPLSMLVLGSKTDLLELAVIFNLPVLLLAILAFVLARRADRGIPQ